jgi:large subunit ribosomal protein L21
MFAVIKTGGKQYKTREGDVLQIEKLDKKKGQKLTFNEVLLIEDEGKAIIGTPLVKNASVKAVVLDNFKDKKVIVFKKKRRKRYKKKAGHRQQMTEIKIEEILYEGKTSPKKETEKPKQKKEVKPESQKTKKTTAPKKQRSSQKPKTRSTVKKKSASAKKE